MKLLTPLFSFIFLVFFSFGVIAQQQKIDSLELALDKIVDKKEKLAVLNQLTRAMHPTNHERKIQRLREYTLLAKELEEYDLMANKSRFLIQQHIIKQEKEKALQLCDSILSFRSVFKTPASEAHILLKRGAIHMADFNYNQAIEDYEASASLFAKTKFTKSIDNLFTADAYFFAGKARSNSGDFIKAIKNYDVAYHIYEQEKDYNYMFYVAKAINELYNLNGLKDIASKRLPELIAKAKAYKAYETLNGLYLSIAHENIENQRFIIGRKYLDSSKQFLKDVKNEVVVQEIEIKVKALELNLHLGENNIKKAEEDYQDILEIEKRMKQKIFLGMTKVYKVKYLLKTNRSLEALKILNLDKENTNGNSDKNIYLLENARLFAEVYDELGNSKQASFYKSKYITLKDSIHKASITNAIAFHQTRFETAQKEKEIITQKAEIKQLETEGELVRSRRNTLLLLLFSIILISIGVFWRGKIKRTQLEKEIERNQTELTDFTKQLLERSKEKETLKLQLEELKEKVTESEVVHSINDLITAKILTKDDWYHFKEKFTKVHPQFFSIINNKGYKLTKSEERLVALEKLGLDNNEIANMLGVSMDSVFTSRYRLRRKIQAPKEVSLVDYLS